MPPCVHAVEEVVDLRCKIQTLAVLQKNLLRFAECPDPCLPRASDALSILISERRTSQGEMRPFAHSFHGVPDTNLRRRPRMPDHADRAILELEYTGSRILTLHRNTPVQSHHIRRPHFPIDP